MNQSKRVKLSKSIQKFCSLNEEMKKHTSFKIGGATKYFFEPDNIKNLKKCIKFCNKNTIPFYTLGNGSNILFSSNGYNGAIIKISKKFEINHKKVAKLIKNMQKYDKKCKKIAKNHIFFNYMNKNKTAFCNKNIKNNKKEIVDYKKIIKQAYFKKAKNIQSTTLIHPYYLKNDYQKNISTNYSVVPQNASKEFCFFSAGKSVSYLSNVCQRHSLSGLEFAVSIPGTLGGAIAMNAGAFNENISNIISKVYVLDIITFQTFWIDKSQCDFSYRHSIFQKDNNLIILGAVLKLQKCDSDYIKEKMSKFINIRKSTQLIKYPSAGSVFRRKENFVPAKFLDENGFKGLRFGDAQVSNVHSGYIVNLGNATSDDVLNLIDFLSKRVLQISNNVLELEIKILGD